MQAIATSMGLLATTTLLLHWMHGRSEAHRHQRRHLGLGAVREGIGLMTAMQQHRGMAAALLNGDDGFAGRLLAKQQDIQQGLGVLATRFAAVPDFASAGRRLERIATGWRQLQSQLRGLNSETSFATHTRLLQQILYLMGDVGERAGLLEARNPVVATLAEALLLRLPLLTESLGQARALGTGFAAQHKCGAVGRIRLSFLERRIRECLEQVATALDAPALGNPMQHCRRKVDTLLSVMETQVIGVERIDLAPDAYFRTATEAIEACLALWHAIAAATERALPASAQPVSASGTISSGVTLAGQPA